MKIYVVCEDYTNAFCGLFLTLEEAEAEEKEIGGYIMVYEIKGEN